MTRYVITMPGKLYRDLTALGAIEDAAISRDAVKAFMGAETRRGRWGVKEVLGTRASLREILEVLKELVLEMDGSIERTRDLGVEASQLRAAARQAMVPYTG